MEAKTGRVVAMASQPTYDPDGLGRRHHHASSSARLYSAKAGNPLLFRATQGQFAPGSTWKPIMTAGALNNGFSPSTRLDCSSGFQVGNRLVQELRVRRPTASSASTKALQISCDTFFYRVGYQLLAAVRHRRRRRERQGPAGRRGQDVRLRQADRHRPARARRPAGSPTGTGSWPTGRRMKDYYCKIDRKEHRHSDFLHVFAHEFCLEGYAYRAGDAVNFVDRPGRHPRHAAPAGPGVRRARPTAARSTSRGSPRRSSAPTAR